MLWLLITACWTPTDTGPRSMIGHVYDPTGAPLPGLSVETIEANALTDGEGYFGVNYKAPNQEVHFTWRGVTFQRNYRPEDDHHPVALRLPELSERIFVCQVDHACQAQLVWELAPGFTATVRGACDPNEDPVRLPVPSDALPGKAVCVAGVAEPETTLIVKTSEEGLLLQPPPVALTVKLFTSDGGQDGAPPRLPSTCKVEADGVPMFGTSQGEYAAQVFGRVQLGGSCDGVPITPRMLLVRAPATVELEWHAETPTIDLRKLVPDAQRLSVYAQAGRTYGWRMEIEAGLDGRFRLPRLLPGTYTFGAHTDAAYLARMQPAVEIPPGVVELTELPFSTVDGKPGREDGIHAQVGMLRLEAPLESGEVPVHRYVEPAIDE